MLLWAGIGQPAEIERLTVALRDIEEATLQAAYPADHLQGDILAPEPFVDCLYVGTCPQPYTQVKAAIQAGTAVLLEDVTRLTLRQLADLCRLSDNEQVVFLCHHPLAYARLMRIIDDHVHEGVIGNVTSLQVTYANDQQLYEGLWLALHYGPVIDDYKRQDAIMMLTDEKGFTTALVEADSFSFTLVGEKGRFVVEDAAFTRAVLYAGDEALTCTLSDDTLRTAINACHLAIGYLRGEDIRYPHQIMLQARGLLRLCTRQIRVIGLTGGIACGKSTVSDYLKQKHYPLVDADVLSHEALKKGTSSYHQIVKAFDVCDDQGEISRVKLGGIVFQDAKKRRMLEGMIHPYVRQQTIKAICDCEGPIIFLDVPLLYEAHFDHLCDTIIVVGTTLEQQISRLQTRNSMNREDAKRRIEAQMPVAEKKARADYYIDNTYDLDCLYRQVDQILEEIADESL